jgi:BolA protein|tara:strand:+ start:6720 stop:7154 length:435 start_codon:yes stop_codon:yes gene_type:complete
MERPDKVSTESGRSNFRQTRDIFQARLNRPITPKGKTDLSVQQNIEQKVQASLAPLHLEVVNESHMHNVPPGSESHFKLVIVSPAFEDLSLVQRHRKVNGILAQELKDDIHALTMETHTAKEWERRDGKTMDSPPCGGGKAGSQ